PLGLGARRITARVGGNQLDLAAGERVVLLLEQGRDALLHLVAALREGSGLDGQQTDLERRVLRDRRRRDPECRRSGAGRGARQKGAPIQSTRHLVSSPCFDQTRFGCIFESGRRLGSTTIQANAGSPVEQ